MDELARHPLALRRGSCVFVLCRANGRHRVSGRDHEFLARFLRLAMVHMEGEGTGCQNQVTAVRLRSATPLRCVMKSPWFIGAVLPFLKPSYFLCPVAVAHSFAPMLPADRDLDCAMQRRLATDIDRPPARNLERC